MAQNIRRLTVDDYDAIINLWAITGLPYKPNGRDSREMMAKELARDYCAFFGLFEDGRMLAVGIANFDGRRGWINRVAVDPDRRGERLAQEIIAVCEKYLDDQGSVVNCALIEEVNGPSISSFQRAGYVCMSNILYFSKCVSSDS